jgi:mannose-6-phosphate isomerase
MSLYPLRFRPILRHYLWGGRRLGAILHKPIGTAPVVAESWEVVDHGVDQSEVAYGPLAGMTLGQLRARRAVELLGRDAASHPDRFPLLFKYLDCQQRLSVQVHPDDARARGLDPPDLGKTEAWHILAADPGSVLYVGLKPAVDRAALERAVLEGTTADCLQVVHPHPGDTFLIRAGVVHALGEGLLVAEIQQSSDTTYRLHDWHRLGPDGQPRQLHVAEALEAIDYSAGPIVAERPVATARPYARQLTACEKFVLERWRCESTLRVPVEGQFRIVSVLSGSLRVGGDPADRPMELGETILVPAGWTTLELTPDEPSELLVASLPHGAAPHDNTP